MVSIINAKFTKIRISIRLFFTIYLIALKIVNAKDRKANVLNPLCPFEASLSWQTFLSNVPWLLGKNTTLGLSEEGLSKICFVLRIWKLFWGIFQWIVSFVSDSKSSIPFHSRAKESQYFDNIICLYRLLIQFNLKKKEQLYI